MSDKTLIADLTKNGRVHRWAHYSRKHYPHAQNLEHAKKRAHALGIVFKTPKKPIIKPIIIEDKTDAGKTELEIALLKTLQEKGVYASWAVITQDHNPGANPEWANDVRKKYGFTIAPKKQETGALIEDRRQANEMIQLQTKNKGLANEVLDLSARLETYEHAANYTPKVFDINAPTKGKQNEATAIIQLSDWHVGERVKKSVTGGRNEYNTAIAKERVVNIVQNSLKLIDIQRAGTNIRELVLHLGGDFITGYIHPELEQENTLAPLEEMEFSLDLLTTAIHYYLDYGKFDTIRCICNRGNHGRLTKKMQGNDYRMNLERTLYFALTNAFKDNKKVIIRADDAELLYMKVYDYNVRFLHGHQVNYMGGIGGFNVPLNRMMKEWDQVEKADYTFLCHHHTYCNPAVGVTINGSLIGPGSRALGKGYAFQRPIQSLTLIDSKRGMTIKAPIFAD